MVNSSYQPPMHGWRTFWIVWLTQSFSALGSQLTFFAIIIWLTQVLYPLPEDKPELAFAISALGIAFGVPAIFGAPLAGAWADRHDRKRTMVVADFLNGLLSLTLMALILTHVLQLWMLLIGAVIGSTLGSFHWSAFNTSYAMIVPAKHLPRANGMMQTTDALSGILAPAIAATIISLPALARQSLSSQSTLNSGGWAALFGAWLASLSDGSALAIAFDAITFFIAAATLLFLLIPSPQRADMQAGNPKVSIWADVREGATYIWLRRPMLWLLGTFAVINLVGAPMGVYQTLILKFNLAPDWSARGLSFETALALINTFASLGGVAGGFLISAWGGLKSRRVYGILFPMIVAGIAGAGFGLSPLIYLSAGLLFFRNAMTPLLNAHSQAIWQAQTPHELQGRVFAVRRLIGQFTFPIGTALGGWAAGVYDVGLITAALGLFMVIFCVAQLFNPFLMRVEDKAWLEELARASTKQTAAAS